MLKSKSYKANYDIEEETMLVYTRTYKEQMHRSRISMSSYARPRDKWVKRKQGLRNTRLGARVVVLARLLVLV